MIDSNHPTAQMLQRTYGVPRSCESCGIPCYPMKVGTEYLCDFCIGELQDAADAEAEERRSA